MNKRHQFSDDADYTQYDDYAGYEYDQYDEYDDQDSYQNADYYDDSTYPQQPRRAARRTTRTRQSRASRPSRHGQPKTPNRGSRAAATSAHHRGNRSTPNRSSATSWYQNVGSKLRHNSFVGMLKKFISAYGWRAYAIPLLTIVTAWVLIDVASSSSSQEQVATGGSAVEPANKAEASGPEGPDPAKTPFPVLPATELPAGGNFTLTGDGTYRTVGTPGAQAGEGKEKTFKYVIEVENGVDTAAYGGDDAFATMVDATLTNVKGWTHDKKFRFEHITETPELKPDLRIQLTSVETTHKNCGTDIAMETSCFSSDGNRVVINESRWVRGATTFQGDLGAYRQYLLNHEVGHGIGYSNHEPCGGQGQLAPVMMQQTLSVSNSELFKIDGQEVYKDDGLVCVTNPWPYPRV